MVPRARLVFVLAATLVLLGSCARAPEPSYPLLDNLGSLHHPITTDSETAQRYFDQGLRYAFGFNHYAAIRSFEVCNEVDPAAAMCHWGKAYSLGPNINMPMGPDAAAEAYTTVQLALKAKSAASAAEQAYIDALAKRYSNDPAADRAKLDRAYAEAMGEVSKKYPDDLDAATIYAEALMDLNPWNHWDKEGNAIAETPIIVATLEGIMERSPDHPGANHLYIHAVEASKNPGRAEAAADRLGKLAPGEGHLVHMPSHIYMRVGRYQDAAEINKRAAAADEDYFSWCQSQGIYRAFYYPHNVHFLWAAASTDGQSDVALIAARKLVQQVPQDQFVEYPFLEDFMPTPTFALLRFGKWDAVLGEPQPAPKRRYETGIWRYAQGLAHARKGRLRAAESQLQILMRIAKEEEVGSLDFFGGTAAQNLEIASAHLAGEIAAEKGDYETAVLELEHTVSLQDALTYTEPPPWYFPTRQALGAVLLSAGRPADAEAVYRKDLEENPGNGWSLYGLFRALEAQDKGSDAEIVKAGFEESWARADVELESSRF